MAVKDFLHAKQNRAELERLQKVVEEMGALDYAEIQKKTAQADDMLTAVVQQQVDIEAENERLSEELAQKRSEIIVADEVILMESFSLYRPTYAFASVEEYKSNLDKNREDQKRMIKNGTAAFGAQEWVVNNSASQGKKLIADMIKLCLRSFNNECEAAIDGVRFNNYERCLQRITKSAETITKTAKMMNINISHGYLKLKQDELRLALEYQMQKQKEKDELKELRAQQREDARVAKELEDARKESLKEQQHYKLALDAVLAQMALCKDVTEMDALKERQGELQEKLGVIAEEIAQIDYREANQRAGYVYIISNIGAFGEGVYKIGMTRRLEPRDRVDELGDASVPFNFDIHALIFSDNAPALEAALHRTFADKRLNYINNRREFFRVPLEDIKKVVHENHDKIVEFVDVAPAEQYRQTLRMTKV